jgi:hypothetical protein
MVNQASGVTTTISSSMSPSTSGLSVTFISTVTPNTATGTITVKDGSTPLGTCSLSTGACTFATNALSVGSHSITGVYGGDANYFGSTSSPLTQVVNSGVSFTTAPTLLTATSGQAMTSTYVASGGTGPLHFSVDETSTAAGIRIGETSGVLTIGSSVAAASYTVTVTATDSNDATAAATVGITFAGAVSAIQAIASKTITVLTPATFTPVTAAHGTGSLTYSVSPSLPTGLTLDSGNGQITGTASAANAATIYTMTATDGNGATGTNTFSLTVAAALTVPVPSGLSGTYGTVFSTNLSASVTGGLGPYTYALTSSLPGGFSFTNAGVLSDSALSTNAGAHSFTVRVTDANGATASTGSFNVVIAKATPVITWNPPASMFTGTVLSATQLNATSSVGSGVITYSPVSGAQLATGMQQTLTATFTPDSTSSGNYNSATVSRTIDVVAPGVPSAPTSVALTASSAANSLFLSWTAPVSTGGSTITGYDYRYSADGGLTWVIAGGANVDGWITTGSGTSVTIGSLVLDTSYVAQVRGVTALGTGTASASSGSSTAGINGPTITTQPINLSLTAGQNGFTLSVLAQGVPATLSYQWYTPNATTHVTGLLAGAIGSSYANSSVVTSDVAGTYFVRVTRTAGGFSATTESTHVVVSVGNAPTITTGSLPIVSPGAAYNAQLSPSGSGNIWSLANGSTLPAGLTLSPSGAITGPAGGSAVTTTTSVTVTDANQVSTTASITIQVSDAVSIAQRTLGNASIGSPYSQTLNAQGGVPSYTWALASGSSLPSGLALGSTGQITGTPTSAATLQRFTLIVTDHNGASAQAALSITIVSAVPAAPTSLTVVQVSSGTATLTWTPTPTGNNGGSPITSYVIDYFSTGDSGAVSVDAAVLAFPYSLTGLANGHTYTLTVRAKNAIATSATSLPATAAPGNLPSAPVGVSAFAANGGLNLSWTKPVDDGGFALTYLVQCKVPGSETMIPITSLTGLVTSATGYSLFVAANTLTGGSSTSGLTYTCQVRANSVVGSGGWSAWTSPALGVASIPSAPSGVTATIGASGVDVTWNTPSSNGSTITSYIATSTRTSSGASNVSTCSIARPTIPTDPTAPVSWDALTSYTCTITGVAAKGTFVITVVAVNALGASLSATAPSLNRPGTPQDLVGHDATHSGATLPASYASAGPIVGDSDFPISAISNSGLSLAFTSTTSTVCSVTPRGMVHIITSGSCSIAIDQSGAQSDYAALAQVTLSFVITPTPPTAPVFTSVTPRNHSLTLAWSASSGTGVEVSDYEVQYSVYVQGQAPNWSTLAHTASTALFATIDGLTNGDAYQVQVRATKAVDSSTSVSSAWTIATGTYTPFTIPDPPTTVSVTPDATSSSALVVWVAPPSPNGSPISGYTVTATPNDHSAAKTCSVGAGVLTCSVTSLANKIPYSFTVVALNAAGPSAPSIAASATLTGLTQTITLGTNITAGGYIAGTSETDVNAKASSGLPLQYRSSDVSICTVSTVGHVTFIYSGTCDISVGQDGVGSNYSPAPGVAHLTFTVLAAKPAMPAIISVVSGSTGLAVTWNVPNFISGTVTYNISAALASAPTTSVATCSAILPASTCTLLGGLSKGETYAITAVAVSSNGTPVITQNSNTTQASFATWTTVPSVPTSLSASRHDATTDGNVKAIDITWSASSDAGGDAITQYVATAYASSVASGSCTVNAAPTMACTIRGVASDISYVIKVVAISSAGASDPATAGSSVKLGLAQKIVFTGSQSATIDQTYGVGAFAQYFAIQAQADSLDSQGNAVAANGQPLTFATSDSTCTVGARSGIVQILHAGTCTITISTIAVLGSDYLAAAPVTVTITSNAAAPLAASVPSISDCPTGPCSPARVVLSGLTIGDTYSVVVHEKNSFGETLSDAATWSVAPSGGIAVTWSDPALQDFSADSFAWVVVTDTLGTHLGAQFASGTVRTTLSDTFGATQPASPSLPGKPAQPTAAVKPSPAIQSATVTWSGLGTTLPVNSYTVQAFNVGSGGHPTTATQLACLAPYDAAAEGSGRYSCTIHDLAYGTNYVFSVLGTNGAGSGSASNFSTSISLTPPLTQAITFGALAPQSYQVGSMLLHASSDSGLPITYTTSPTSVCVIDSHNGALLQFLTAGDCTLTASQNGLDANGVTTNYLPAGSITQSFAITAVLPDPTAIVENDTDADVRGVIYEIDWSQAINLGGSAFRFYEIHWAPHVLGQAPGTAGSHTETNRAILDYDIQGMSANVLYDVQVRVVTTFGVSAWSDPLLAMTYHSPGQPTAVTALAVTGVPGTVSVSWIEPTDHNGALDNGGTPIIGYTAEALVASDLSSTGSICIAPAPGVGGGTVSCTISGLNGSTAYLFRVEAINGVGSTKSETSDPLHPISLGLRQTIAFADITVSHSVGAIALAASSDSGLPITYSVISSTPTFSSGSRTVCSVDARGHLAVDLAGTCTVQASQNGTDASGALSYYSAAASKTAIITVTAVAPTEIQNATATSGDGKLALVWEAPAHDGGLPITHYIIKWYPSRTGSLATALTDTISASRTSYTIGVDSLSSLTNGVAYTITVQAQSRVDLIGP